MSNNPYQAYKQQAVMTMTPGQILVALYDELIKQINITKIAFQDNAITTINQSLQKAQRIIRELQSSLNYDYEISNNLNSLYDYFYSVIMNANIKKDDTQLDEIIEMLTDLRNSFAEASKSTRS